MNRTISPYQPNTIAFASRGNIYLKRHSFASTSVIITRGANLIYYSHFYLHTYPQPLSGCANTGSFNTHAPSIPNVLRPRALSTSTKIVSPSCNRIFLRGVIGGHCIVLRLLHYTVANLICTPSTLGYEVIEREVQEGTCYACVEEKGR